MFHIRVSLLALGPVLLNEVAAWYYQKVLVLLSLYSHLVRFGSSRPVPRMGTWERGNPERQYTLVGERLDSPPKVREAGRGETQE